MAAAGEPDIVDTLKAGHTIGDKTYKVHIDGYNLLPYLTGQEDKSPRRGMICFSDDGDVLAIRAENWKLVFMEQRCPGTLMVWANPFTALRVPKMFNLRTDPYERADITAVESLHVPPRRGSTQLPDDFRRNPIGQKSSCAHYRLGKVKPRQQTSRRHSRLRSSLPNVAGAGGVTSSTLPIPVACRSKQCVQALPVCGIECTAGRMLFECDS